MGYGSERDSKVWREEWERENYCYCTQCYYYDRLDDENGKCPRPHLVTEDSKAYHECFRLDEDKL